MTPMNRGRARALLAVSLSLLLLAGLATPAAAWNWGLSSDNSDGGFAQAALGLFTFTDQEIQNIKDNSLYLAKNPISGDVSFGNSTPDVGVSKDYTIVNRSKETRQQKIELYLDTLDYKQGKTAFTNVMHNHVAGSKNEARLKAQKAYIEALQNGRSQASAKAAARVAIQQYYDNVRTNLVHFWNAQAINTYHASTRLHNNSRISNDFLYLLGDPDASTSLCANGDNYASNPAVYAPTAGSGYPNKTVTLQTGRTLNVIVLKGTAWGSFSPLGASTYYDCTNHRDAGGFTPTEIWIKPPTSDHTKQRVIDGRNWVQTWNKLDRYESQSQASVDQFLNQVSPQIESGQVAPKDLVTPALASRYYSPQNDTTTWTAMSLAELGIMPPRNITGSQTIRVGGENLSGVLLSDGLPQGDSFQENTTYDSGQLSGPQYVLQPDGTLRPVTGQFTPTDLPGGDRTVYRNVSYQTGNLTEYRDMAWEMQAMRNELQNIKYLDDAPAPKGGGITLGGILDPLSGSILGVPKGFIAFLATIGVYAYASSRGGAA